MSTKTDSASTRADIFHGGAAHQAASFASLLNQANQPNDKYKSTLDTLIAMARASHSPSERTTLRSAVQAILDGPAPDGALSAQLSSLAGQTSDPRQKAALQKAANLLSAGGPQVGNGGGAPASANPPPPAPPILPPPAPPPPAPPTSPPPAPPPPAPPPTPLTESSNSIDTGRYIITFSTDYSNSDNSKGAKDGQIRIFDTKTNTYVDVFGDPHVLTSGGQQAHFDKGGLQIDLADGTVVQVKPTALHNGTAHIADVAVSKNGQTIGANGLYGGNGVHLTGVMNKSAAAYDSYFSSGNESVLVADSSKGLGSLSQMNANGQLAALPASGDTNLDNSDMAALAAAQKVEALLNSGVDASLKSELQAILNTLLDKPVAEGSGKVANKNRTVDLYVNYNTSDSVSVSITPRGKGATQLVNTAGQGAKAGPDAIRLTVPANDENYTVTVKDNTTGKTTTQTIKINPDTFSGGSVTLAKKGAPQPATFRGAPSPTPGNDGTVDVSAVPDPKASTRTLPPPPFSVPAMSELQADLANYQSDFLKLLKTEPDKSPGKILYNLEKLIGISQNSHYTGKIDVAKVQADIQSTIKNNQSYFNNLHDQIVTKYAQQATGLNATAAAKQLQSYVDSPAFAKYVLTLNPAERQTAMNTYIGTIASLDPSLGKTAMTGLLKTMLNLPSSFLNQVQTPQQRQKSLDSIVSTILDDARLGTGVLNNLSKYMQNAGLTKTQISKVASVLSKNLSTVLSAELNHPGSISAAQIHTLTQEMDGQLNSAGEVGLANRALEEMSSKGIIGALGGASSLVGLVTGFTGNSDQGNGAFFIIGQLANASFLTSKLNDLKKLFVDSGALSTVSKFFSSLAGASASQIEQAAKGAKGNAAAFATSIAKALGKPSQAAKIQSELAKLPADQQGTVLQTLSTQSGATEAVSRGNAAFTTNVLNGVSATKLEQAAKDAGGSINKFAELVATDHEITSVGQQEAIQSSLSKLTPQQQTSFLDTLRSGGSVQQAVASVGGNSDLASGIGSAGASGSGGAPAADKATIASLEAEGLTEEEAITVAGITDGISASGDAAGSAASGLAGSLGKSLTWAKFLKFTGFLGPLGTALYGVGAGAAAANDFKDGNIPGGVFNSLSVASLGVLATANVAGLVFAATEWIPVVGEIAGIVTIVFSIIAAIFDGGKKDPNQTLAQTGVGNGQDYWQPDVSSAQKAAGQGSVAQALIALLEQVQSQNRHMTTTGRGPAIPVAGPIVIKLQPLINQLKALPPGQMPSKALLTQIQNLLGVPSGSGVNPSNTVNAEDQLTFQDIEARLPK